MDVNTKINKAKVKNIRKKTIKKINNKRNYYPREYEVEKIIDKQTKDDIVYYKIKWKGYPESQSTWEPAENLHKLKNEIEEFEYRNKSRKISESKLELKKAKKSIKFKYDSLKRRNVDKHIIRNVILCTSKLYENIQKGFNEHGISQEIFKITLKSFDSLKSQEKSSETKVKKDYGKTINVMLLNIETQIIMKCCLEDMISKITNKEECKIKGKNRKIYKATLEDYLNYVTTLISKK